MEDKQIQGYCPACETDQPIKKTVPWQPDFCAGCGADIELG